MLKEDSLKNVDTGDQIPTTILSTFIVFLISFTLLWEKSLLNNNNASIVKIIIIIVTKQYFELGHLETFVIYTGKLR